MTTHPLVDSTMRFADPSLLWLLILVPMWILAASLLWRRRLRAIAVWSAPSLWDRLLAGYSRLRLVISVTLLAIAVAGLALALAQPRWGTQEQTIERRGVDLVFVLDTSLSMAARDVAPSRLWVAQTLVRRLLNELPGHRVGLVQAEGDGVVMVPLTRDAAAIELLLDTIAPGYLPFPGTELAAALERSLDLFSEETAGPADGPRAMNGRAIVLLSDGEDHGSGLDSVLERLRERRAVIFAIGIGTPEGHPLEVPQPDLAAPVEYKRDAEGNVVISRLNATTLEALAQGTGGLYQPATGAAADLGPLVGRITEMATQNGEVDEVVSGAERFQWPLAAAALALALHLALAPFRTPTDPPELS